ncbi:retrovirus-related pol polyprotein from transposon TNT 1-94 [Tanacetum coccineum]
MLQKQIAKPITPPSESASKEDSDPEQAQRDKDMQKIWHSLQNTTPRYKNDNQTGQFGNQRAVTVVGARETETKKRIKDYSYHKEKMLMCKQAEKGVPLQAEQADWLEDTDEEINEQELEAHYGFMAKIQETDQNAEDERDALTNLIANLTLDTEENKKILKQLNKENASLTQELKVGKSNLEESNSTRDSCLIALQCKQTELEKYMAFNDRTVDYDKLERKLNKTLGLLAQKEIDIKEGLKLKAYEISVVKEKHDELVKQSLLTKSHYEGLVKEKTKVITDLKSKEEKDIEKMISMEKQLKFLNEIVYKRNQLIQTIHIELVDQAWEKHSHDHFRAPTAHDMEILIKTCLMPLALKTQNDSFTFVHELKQEMHADLKYVESLEKGVDELESDKQIFKHVIDLLLQECVSKDIMCSYLPSLSDLDAHTELQCLYLHKVKECECTEFLNKTLHSYFKEEGIEHQTSTPRTPEQNGVIERRNRTLVEAARTMLLASKLPLDGKNLDKIKEKGDPCILVEYSTQSKGYCVYNKRTKLIVKSIHLRFDEIKEMSEMFVDNNTSGLVLQ